MTVVLWFVFALPLAIMVYHIALYPLILQWAGARFGRPLAPVNPPDVWPEITVLIPAYNEEKIIARKIENLGQIEYPRDKIHIRLALDGCSDQTQQRATEAAARQTSGLDIQILSYPRNIGKVAVLNSQISTITTPLVALSDASAFFAPGAIKQAVAHFNDPNIGVVFPTYALSEPGSAGEQAYIRYLTHVKALETTLDSAIGGHGALYLFRRPLWQPLAPDTINDDYILPLRIVAAGYRGLYDPEIVAVEMEKTQSVQEFRRRMRLSAGNMQQTLALVKLADPRRFWLAFMFVSGKGLRPFIPLLAAISAFAANLLALRYSVLAWVLLSAAMGAAAMLALGVRQLTGVPPFVLKVGYALEGLAASLIGTVKYLLGLKAGQWQRSKTDQSDRVAAATVYQSQTASVQS